MSVERRHFVPLFVFENFCDSKGTFVLLSWVSYGEKIQYVLLPGSAQDPRVQRCFSDYKSRKEEVTVEGGQEKKRGKGEEGKRVEGWVSGVVGT